jgi:asparagine synthase (glutamine-hydrolysing)
VRTAVHTRRFDEELTVLPWLTPEGIHQVARAMSASEGAIPVGWEAKIRKSLWPSRYLRVCRESFRVVGAYHDVRVVHPFVEAEVLDALGTSGGFRGLHDRAALMRHVFGDLLPEELLQRRTKATFTNPLWTSTSRQFAHDWSGEGVDRALIDSDALRRHWSGGNPHVLSTTLLQAAWLHDHSETQGDLVPDSTH